MKRHVLAAVVAVGLLGNTGQADEPAKTPAASGGPKIEFDRVVYDFGKTSTVSKLEGIFVISNTGDAVLEKLQAKATCGCTSAPLKTDKLAPGEKTELAFTLNVGAMVRGPMEKHITVTSNDPQRPTVNLALKAQIQAVYEYNPQALMVGDLHVGATTNFTIEVKRTDGKPHGITKVEAGPPLINATLQAVEATPEIALVQVQVTGTGELRRFNDSVRIFAENPAQPMFVVGIAGRLVGDLALTQEALFWGVADRENWPGPRGALATTRKIVVTSTVPEQKLELSELTSSVPELKVQFKPDATGQSYEIVAVLDQLPKESTSGTIKFATNLKTQPTVEVKVTINILKRG